MPRIHIVNQRSIKELDRLLKIEQTYQATLSGKKPALVLTMEYLFLSGYKVWENFLEELFVSQSRYNDPVSGKRTFPYLAPKTENHALGIIKLEKDYVDWTTPDIVVTRAELLFQKHSIITRPIKASMSDLRDAKKIRNYIAHGSLESKRIFKKMALQRTGYNYNVAGEFLLHNAPSSVNYYCLYYLNLFKDLVNRISK